MRIRIKITWRPSANRGLAEVEADCVAAGLASEGATYEPGYPIYGEIDASQLAALFTIPDVVHVEEVSTP